MSQRCSYCRNGVVLPRYRKDLPTTYRCNRCRRIYTPAAKFSAPYRIPESNRESLLLTRCCL